MIDFEFSQAQKNVKAMAHWLAESEVRPVSLQADREGAFPDSLLRKLMELGVGGGALIADKKGDQEVGSSVGGSEGFTQRVAVIGAEELSWGDASLAINLPGPGLGGPPVKIMGTEEQKERFLGIFDPKGPPRYGAYALTEPGAGSDSKAITTTCRREGDEWVINGVKCFITNGAKAEWNVVFATVDKSLGRQGFRAFVVERDRPGFRVGRIEKKLGLRASETAELVFEDCRVPAENLLGGDAHYASKEGFLGAMKTFDNTRPLVAAMAIGIARASLERTRDWLKERYDLSRPIPRYARLKDTIAEHLRMLDAARLLTWRAAWMGDNGVPNTKEASMSKAFAGRVATNACAACVDVMGADGLDPDAFVEKWFRDIKVYDIFEGTGQVQRVVIAKRLMESYDGR